MRRIKLLVVVLALILLMSTAAIAQTEQTESGWYYYPDEGGWWYYWAETGEWAQDPGTQPATSSGSVCQPKVRVVVNGRQIC
jgi:opacity protein-like surface antigen